MNIEVKMMSEFSNHVRFNDVNIGQMVMDQDGWLRVRLCHGYYLVTKGDVTKTHPSGMWPAELQGTVRNMKFIIEEV